MEPSWSQCREKIWKFLWMPVLWVIGTQKRRHPIEIQQGRVTATSSNMPDVQYYGNRNYKPRLHCRRRKVNIPGLSYALREAIPIMELLKEMKSFGFPIQTAQARVHCRVFEDNSGALEMAKTHKFRPRTKHLNVKLHHFRDYVTRQEISIHPIGTADHSADYLTKALNEELHLKHRKEVQGW